MIEKKRGISLTRRIKASTAKLYDAWTDPAKLAQWWAPRGVEVVSCEADVRVGGAYRILMRDVEGRLYDLAGEYRDLKPGAKLVFTWGFSPEDRDSVVTVTFRADGNETELTLTHEGEADDATRANREQGWSSLLGRLSYFLDRS
jgi:uncharacterized protein YndB with AHSA1/START domain